MGRGEEEIVSDPLAPPPPRDSRAVIGPGHTFGSVTDKISSIVLTRKTPLFWTIGFGIGFLLTLLLLFAVGVLFFRGIGVWGVNAPVGWGFAIVNFVWWIGIGHAGTLISAILLLLRQEWRTSINRFAEAMTLFAVAQAGMYPILHLGRPWLAYWLTPYPNTMALWPQFRSPLVWDVFAVSTYATVSLLFWYVGLIPDLATLRDRSTKKIAQISYGMLAMGWRGSAMHWHRYDMAYLLLAGIATPLVVSVHTVVSFDFTIGIIPGWHSTIFPPYFVAGAIYGGFAMVLTIAIPLRAVYKLEDFVTLRHLQNMAKILLATGLIVGYGYMIEAFMSWYSGSPYEKYMMWNRLTGPYWPVFWGLMLCNIVTPQFLWFKKIRSSPLSLWVDRGHRQRRHVAGALRHRRHEPAPRLPPLLLGDVLPDEVRLGDLRRHARLLRGALLPLHPVPADDLDLRDADARARGGDGQGDERMSAPAHPRLPLHGVIGEFEDPNALVEAARRAREAGYRKMDAYTPYPIHELTEALGLPRTRLPMLVLIGGAVGCATGLLHAVVRDRRPLSDQRRRAAARELALLHPDHFRADRPLRRHHGGPGHARLERPPDALPPRLQRSPLRPRLARPLLPLHRSAGPALRPAEDQGFSEQSRRAGSLRGGERMRSALSIVPCSGRVLLPRAACRQEMYDQAKYKPLGESRFFTDRRASRPLPAGTVARGWLRDDQKLYEGKQGRELVATLPVPLTRELLARGRERFNIFCSPCHDRTGGGRGMVVRRGYQPPPSLHIDRLRDAPVGHFFDVMTNGLGAMPDYASQIDVSDRWAIAAYVKALQLSQNAPVSDVPPEKQADLAKAQPPAPGQPVQREMGQAGRNKPVIR